MIAAGDAVEPRVALAVPGGGGALEGARENEPDDAPQPWARKTALSSPIASLGILGLIGFLWVRVIEP